MGFRINTNIDAIDAQRNLSMTALSYSKSIEKLSSGLRINRAGDDAAGLSISEKLRAQVRGLNQAVNNAQDGISMVQTTEGALTQVQAIMQRMRELGVQGANGTLSIDDRKAISSELGQLKSEVDRIATVTDFNGMKLLSGSNTVASTAGGTITMGGSISTTSVTVSANVNFNSTVAAGTYTVTVQSVDSNGLANSVVVTNSAGVSSAINFSGTGTSVNIGNGLQFSFSTAVSANSTFTIAITAGSAATSGAQTASLQIGANNSAQEQLSLSVSTVNSLYLGDGTKVTSLSGTNLYATKNLSDAITQVTNMLSNSVAGDIQGVFRALTDSASQALKDVSAIRGTLGASQNRLENTIANLGVAAENLSASESRIRDVDMAKEMVNFTKTQILQQAGTSILSQANQSSQSVLSLLR
jgi:flagellin